MLDRLLYIAGNYIGKFIIINKMFNTLFSNFSAGIGRSGTFCLVDCCLVLIDKDGENRVSVQDVLLELRKYRMGLIQTHDQLTFSYEAIVEGMKRMNNDVS
jgi:protein tyrosine phosphatase